MKTNQPVPDLNDLGGALRQFKTESDASIAEVQRMGLTIDLGPWMTITNYAKKYDLTTQQVTTWINRGIIPADCVEILPELNDIRLVKDKVYK